MKLSALNDWLSLAANLGVIAGIVFLAVEIQQNTAVTQSAMAQEMSNSARDFYMRIAENPDLARVLNAAETNPDNLTEVEVTQYRHLTGSVFMFLEGAFTQYQLGFLSESDWAPYERLIRYFLGNPVSREWWVSGGAVFSPAFEAKVAEVSGVQRDPD